MQHRLSPYLAGRAHQHEREGQTCHWTEKAVRGDAMTRSDSTGLRVQRGPEKVAETVACLSRRGDSVFAL